MDKEFHRLKSREHYQKYKDKYSERNKTQRARTKAIIQEAKKTGCFICSEVEPACLDFHHLGGKDYIVSAMLGMNDVKVTEEISKCVVLCANCHRKVHAGLLDIPL